MMYRDLMCEMTPTIKEMVETIEGFSLEEKIRIFYEVAVLVNSETNYDDNDELEEVLEEAANVYNLFY